MSTNVSDVIGNAARIFNDAQLDNLSPAISGLGKELGVLRIALHAIGDNSEIQNRLLESRGIEGVLEQAEFMMRKIAADEVLSHLIHDRTCAENKYVNAFLPEVKGRRTSNIVGEIQASASELTGLKEALYPAKPAAEEALPGMERVRPENERFANATRDLSALKKNLQQAAIPKK